MKRKIIKLMFVLSVAVSFAACSNKTGKLQIDGKMYAVSISDVVDNTEKGDYTVRFNLEDDLIKKCEETAASP
ncbi:MAG: hypothetical protein LBC68_12685, partial [Prevotellaceae bacterium]|nr:hypothetical protein [Prevotellaceae bacterium]